MGLKEHRKSAPSSITVATVTVSDTRSLASDTSGAEIVRLLEAAGHVSAGRVVVRDDATEIAVELRARLADARVDAIILNGGTGISARDGTVEVVARFLDRVLDGFGELFRALSYEEIGAAAMLSRALAGVAGDTVVFCLPGSTGAVRLAMEKLIVPELGHIVGELRKGAG